MKIVKYNKLKSTDLIIDAVYEGSSDGKLAGEPISSLLPGVGNMGGFRISGKGKINSLLCCSLLERIKIGPIILI